MALDFSVLEGMKHLSLTQGYVALVDDEDYKRLSRYEWYPQKARNTVYGVRNQGRRGQKQIYLHRQIMQVTDPKVQVDHRNRNGLDCQRHNLRIATPSNNGANQTKRRDCSSRFKGVGWDKQTSRWQARITVNYKSIRLGRFSSEIEAAKAYDNAARQYFGEFARVNFA